MTAAEKEPAQGEPNEPSELGDEEARLVAALIARGEAARAIDGKLPDGATHEILEDEHGRISVVRRRFAG